MSGPASLTMRTVGEWSMTSSQSYESPFVDVLLEGVFTSPSGATFVVPGFYDGDQTWRLRFNPNASGRWTYETRSRPNNADLNSRGEFEVSGSSGRGFLRSTPGEAWGFKFENDEPVLILGDTTYDLFAMEYCGGDVAGFLERRKEQGFNLFRVRLTTSEFHLPSAPFDWQTKNLWPWGGSRSLPRFDQFNLDLFHSIDKTVQRMEDMGLGMEMIMEGWGNEFPFNSRQWFTPEWEEHWMRYLIARYDAYNSTWIWTPLNEYEYYPNGDWHWKPAADRWALRIARRIKEMAQHGHVLAMHNGPVLPPFAQRFKADPEAVDTVMFQSWGTRDKEEGWLARGIENTIQEAFAGWTGSVVFSEWGYERNPSFELKLPSHEYCDRNHTRRSAWRGVTQAVGICNGQEESWGPWMVLDSDSPGVADIIVLQKFFNQDVPFHELAPAPDLVTGDYAPGYKPLALRSGDGRLAVVYFPTGGRGEIAFAGSARWFDPRNGSYQPAQASGGSYIAPPGTDEDGHPLDFVLVLQTA